MSATTHDRFILMASLCFALAACSGSSGEAPSPNPGPDMGGGSGPTQDPQQPPGPNFDIDMSALAPNGCMDIQVLRDKLSALPSEGVVRSHTRDVAMEKQSVDGKTLKNFRNMSVIAAFGKFDIQEKALPLFLADQSGVIQYGCTSVEFADAIGGKEAFEVQPGEPSNTLLLRRYETKVVDNAQPQKTLMKEIRFVVRNPRELEITTLTPTMDRCPDHLKAWTTDIRAWRWGSQSELNAAPIQVTSNMMKMISTAVVEMPRALSDLLTQSSSELITPAAADLYQLKTAKLDPRIDHCPYDATPPGTDEPPPAEEPETPTQPTEPTTPTVPDVPIPIP